MADLDFTNWDAAGQGYRDAADGEPLNADEAYICPVTDRECEYGLACVLFHCVSDRTKRAEKQTSISETHPPGPRCTCWFHVDRDEIVDPDPHCPIHGSVIGRSDTEEKT